MVYAKAFFDLQLLFARRVAELSGLPLEQILFAYTNFYIRFGLGGDFHRHGPAHPVWRQYLAGLRKAGDENEWTYSFYLTRSASFAGPPAEASFGCFSCALMPGDRIRLHFRNTDTDGGSSLGIAHVGKRRSELAALFEHVRRTRHEGIRVVGISWLYNLEAYRRLFPASYIAGARSLDDRFHSMPRWGQFVDRFGELKESMARPFLERLAGMEDLHLCFPLQVLTVEAPVGEFYGYYGI